MAYPTICQTCRAGHHDKCEISLSHKQPGVDVGYGGWFCVCAHGGEENEFQRSVREGIEKGEPWSSSENSTPTEQSPT